MTRKERIIRMLHELHYEVHIAMLEGDMDETFNFEFVIPVSKNIRNGVVFCTFETRPISIHTIGMRGIPLPQKLQLVKKQEGDK